MIFQRVAKHVAIWRNVGAESLFYDNPKIIIENPNYRLTRRGGFLLSHPRAARGPSGRRRRPRAARPGSTGSLRPTARRGAAPRDPGPVLMKRVAIVSRTIWPVFGCIGTDFSKQLL